MNPELEFKTEEDKIKFQDLLKEAFAKMNNYEKQSIEVILNLYKSLKELKDNKLRMTKYLVEDIDKLISLIRLSEGKPEDQKKMMDEIKALQSNISKYMETSDEEIYESIRRNIDEINKLNQQLITNKQGYVSDEDKQKQEEEKLNELRYLNERQNKLHQILDAEIKKELRKLKANSKPFDFQKLDKAYRNLYVALEKEDKEEIIQKRGRLIRLLEANKKEINKQYEELKSLEEIKEVFESEEAQEIKLQRINEILRRAENTNYAYYFNNINEYDELRKEFYNLYEFLEVNKTRLYKEALKQELKRHGEEIKEAYGNELIDKKHQASVLTQALPMTMGLSIQKMSNTMAELRNATSDRQKAEMRKELVKDLGRIVVTPVANIAKFTANNWYTLSLLHKGYNTAKAKAEAEEKAKTEAEEKARKEAEQAQEEQQQQEAPEHVGAEYDDPEFEEEVTRLMKTGEFQSVDEAEHQALINLGRIPPDEPEAKEETPDGPREVTGHGPMVLNPELKTEFETREEAIEYLMGQNARLTREMAEKIVDTGIDKGTIKIGDEPVFDFPKRKLPGIKNIPRPGESEDQESEPEEPEQNEELQEATPDNLEPVVEDPTPEPVQELSEVQEKLNGMAVGETITLRDNVGGGTYEVIKNEDGTFNVTVYGANGEVSQTLENIGIDLFGSAFEIAPTPEVPEQNEEQPEQPEGQPENIEQVEIDNNNDREAAIQKLQEQNPGMSRADAERNIDYIQKVSGKSMTEILIELQRGKDVADYVAYEREQNAHYREEAAKGLMKFAPEDWKTMDEALEKVDQMVRDSNGSRTYQSIAEDYEQWNGECKEDAITTHMELYGVPRDEAEAAVEAMQDTVTYRNQYEQNCRLLAAQLYGGNMELVDNMHNRMYGRAYSDIYNDFVAHPRELALFQASAYLNYQGLDASPEEVEQLVEEMVAQAEAEGITNPYLYTAAALDQATPDTNPNGYETVSGTWEEVPLEEDQPGFGIGWKIPGTNIHLPKILSIYRDDDGWHCAIEDYPEDAEEYYPIVELIKGLTNSK